MPIVGCEMKIVVYNKSIMKKRKKSITFLDENGITFSDYHINIEFLVNKELDEDEKQNILEIITQALKEK